MFSIMLLQKQPPEVFCKKGVLKIFAKFTGKHLCKSLFFNKVAGLWPVNFVKFPRTPFLHNTSGRLLLIVRWSVKASALLTLNSIE